MANGPCRGDAYGEEGNIFVPVFPRCAYDRAAPALFAQRMSRTLAMPSQYHLVARTIMMIMGRPYLRHAPSVQRALIGKDGL